MNKKILLSTAAAVVLAVGFTGCGSSGTTSTANAGNAAIIPADGYIYGSTVSCANGTATRGDDNLTVTVNSSSPGLCTVTGGAHLIGGAYVTNTAVMKVNVPADSNGTVYATPITTMAASSGSVDSTLRLLGIDPAGKTEAQKNALITADPTNLPAEFNAAARVKVVQVYNIMNQLANANVSSSAIDDVLTALANSASLNTNTGDLNSTSLQTALTNAGVSSTVAVAIKSSADSINTKLGGLTKDELEASTDTILKTLDAVKSQIADGNLTTDLNASFDANAIAIQNALSVVYIAGVDGNDTNGTYKVMIGGTPSDINASTQEVMNSWPTLGIKLSDQNVTDGNYTADVSFLFKNEGNANYSMKSVLKDIAVAGSSDKYTFTLANNTNVSVAGTSYTGVDFTSGTFNADSNVTLNGATQMNLIAAYGSMIKAIETNATTGITTMDADRIGLWAEHKLGVDDNTTVTAPYGVNNNWSVKVLLNLKDDTNSTVSLYKAQSDGKLSTAAKDSITIDTQRNGAVLFNGRFYQ